MVIKIELVSKNTIKPSSPTPSHLKTLTLSFLDQIAPPIFACTCLFYDAPSNPKIGPLEISRSLKNSLARVLTLYYPFAGKLNGNSSIDCSDQGVEFTEKWFSCKLSDIKRRFDLEVLKKFFPFGPQDRHEMESGKVLAIQLSHFQCNGFVIGVCISHKIADANSMISFVKAWVATSRGDSVLASFESAAHFPPRTIVGFDTKKGILENLVSKRLVFKPSTIHALKRDASLDGVKDPTRVEVVSAFIWKRFIEIVLSRLVEKRPKLLLSVHMVNMRERMAPPLPDHAIGNIVRPAFAPLLIDDNTKWEDYKIRVLVQKLRDGIKEIDANYVRNLQQNVNYLGSIKEKTEKYISYEVESLNFSSLYKFQADESDFGWGRPVWMGVPTGPYKNMVVLTNHLGEGGGMEALVRMTKQDMTIFQEDVELLPFFSSTIADSMLKSNL